MTAVIRRSMTPAIVATLIWLALFLNTSAAHAQCTTLTITNNMGCGISLCIYSTGAAAPRCWDVPAGSTIVITALPPSFVPAGGVSASGARYPFSATGCTVCYSQRTFLPVICCAEVCYNSATCTITIGPCTTPVCHP